MTAKLQPDFDRVACRKALAQLLQDSDFDPDHSEDLDANFARLLVAKRLLQEGVRSPLKDLSSDAKVVSVLSRRLAAQMHFDSEGMGGVFAPVLLELLSDAFDGRVVDPSGDEVPLQGKIKGWHTGQWGVWSQRLADDLFLLQSLITKVRQRLKEEGTGTLASPAMTEEDLVLEIHALLIPCLPEGKNAKTLDQLIASIMTLYNLDAHAPTDEDAAVVVEDITTDKVRGILRKHKKTGVSR